MSDDEQPTQIRTKELPAADKTAIQLAELKILLVEGQKATNDRVDSGFKAVKADMELLGGQFESLEQDVRGLQSWRVRMEDRQTAASMRAKAPSLFDLEQDTKLANALTELAEEKAKREKLEENSATKADLEAVARAQTTDIVTKVEALAAKNPRVKQLLIALAVLALVALNALTNYLTAKGHP